MNVKSFHILRKGHKTKNAQRLLSGRTPAAPHRHRHDTAERHHFLHSACTAAAHRPHSGRATRHTPHRPAPIQIPSPCPREGRESRHSRAHAASPRLARTHVTHVTHDTNPKPKSISRLTHPPTSKLYLFHGNPLQKMRIAQIGRPIPRRTPHRTPRARALKWPCKQIQFTK